LTWVFSTTEGQTLRADITYWMTLSENRYVPEIEYAWLIFDYGGDKIYGLVSTLQ